MNKKILIVDDDNSVLKFMSKKLKEFGHEVRTAENAIIALDILSDYIPDLILVDLIMPQISGEMLCKIIRSMDRFKKCNLVIVSGAAAELDFDYESIGVNACMAKGTFGTMAENVQKYIEDMGEAGQQEKTKGVLGLEGVYSRKMTKELLFLNKRLETVLESIAEGILEINTNRIIYANSAAEKMLDRPKEKIIASRLIDVFDEDAKPMVQAIMDSGSTQESGINLKKAIPVNDRKIEMKCLPVKGEVAASIVFLTDVTELTKQNQALIKNITERKKAEKERRRIEEFFQQAYKIDALTALTGGIAVDFSKILTQVDHKLPSAPNEKRDCAECIKICDSIKGIVGQGLEMSNQLLAFASDITYDIDCYDVNDIVNNALVEFEIIKNDAKVKVDLKNDLNKINVDKGQVILALISLLISAWQSIHDDSPIRISTTNESIDKNELKAIPLTSGDYVRISISDSGVGFDEETVKRLFDPFFNSQEVDGGTNLGLAAAYGIIRNHSGVITATSKKGAGSTFDVYLPAMDETD